MIPISNAGQIPADLTILVTGGAGFIGSALCRLLIQQTNWRVINVDKLSYASDLRSLAQISGDARYQFVKADITDRAAVDEIFAKHRPDAVMHLAAESHVDRSIEGPGAFISTNIVGTYNLLEAFKAHLDASGSTRRENFRFLHVSTDEVFGSLGEGGYFTETTAYDPRSPYSASKASSDHLVMAWHHTYGLPVLVTNCGNNYGPYQFPEKFIPTMIIRALRGQKLPVYGSGSNVRDWIYVDDHVKALIQVLTRGVAGQKYNVGASEQRTNLSVAQIICDLVDDIASPNRKSRELIEFVEDRPGHDQRYAIDASRVRREIGWQPSLDFEQGIAATVRWYFDNKSWWSEILESGRYGGQRLGLASTATGGMRRATS